MLRTMLLIIGCTISVQALAQQPHQPINLKIRAIGEHAWGTYNAGHQHVIFVAAEFTGTFSLKNISQTFHYAVGKQREGGKVQTAVALGGGGSNNRQYRLAPDRHAVLGFFNIERTEWFFVGVRIMPDGRSCHWIVFDGKQGHSSTSFNDWKFRTNGFELRIHFADDDHHGLSWRFTPPQ